MVSEKIYNACGLAYVEDARDMISKILGIRSPELAYSVLPTQREWMHASTYGRSHFIRSWLMAECAAVGDQSRRLVTCDDPIDVVGTRD